MLDEITLTNTVNVFYLLQLYFLEDTVYFVA